MQAQRAPASGRRRERQVSALPHFHGRAPEASLRAEISRSTGAERRRASVQLARLLVSQERCWAEAVALAREALHTQEDFELRRELASWQEHRGEPAAAAEELRALAAQLDSSRAARTWTRIGLLYARGGQPERARAAFEEASRRDPHDAVAKELEAALGGAGSVHAYLEAARRRGFLQEAATVEGAPPQVLAQEAMDDVLRAFEAEPASIEAAAALVAALERRGSRAQADEVLRMHAAERGLDARHAVHARRRERLEAQGHLEDAFVAAIDEDLDADLDRPDSQAFDDLAARLGRYEIIAARYELRAENARPEDRARAWQAAADLYKGPLADQAAAARALSNALASDPEDAESRAALQTHPRGAIPLVVAELVGAKNAPSEGQKLVAARALANGQACADFPLASRNALTAWAWRRILEIQPDDAEARQALANEGGDDAERTERVAAIMMLDAATSETARRTVAALAMPPGADEIDPSHPLAADDVSPTMKTATAWTRAAVGRDRAGRAHAIEEVARGSAPALASRLLSFASETARAAGDATRARQLANEACLADPGSLRARVALADAAIGAADRDATQALERAASRVLPRARWMAALALASLVGNQPAAAVAWTQRALLVRPWDAAALDAVVDATIAARDAVHLRDSLAWGLAQPRPHAELAARMARALPALVSLDVEAAMVIARRTLDVLGAEDDALRAAMDDVAARAGDPAFRAALRERRGPRVTSFEALEIAELRRASGDADGVMRAVLSALEEGAEPSEAQELARTIEWEALDGDGQLAHAAFGAELAARAVGRGHGGSARGHLYEAWSKLRLYGAARWDLASDVDGAVDAWIRAARLETQGFAVFRSDLLTRTDATSAAAIFAQRTEHETEPRTRAALLVESSHLALAARDPERALALATSALTADPRATAALPLFDLPTTDAATMSTLYGKVAAHAAGRFGRRAAHLRAARSFERRGDMVRALDHAEAALFALPAEGAALQLLLRIADRSGQTQRAVEMLTDVADRAAPRERSPWLLHASRLAAKTGSEAGLRRRVDLVLAALQLSPTKSTFDDLNESLVELLAVVPADREGLADRIASAATAAAERLDGPEGARVALGFGATSLHRFSDASEVLVALERALAADADVDDYADWITHADTLVRAPRATLVVRTALAGASKPYANVGVPALRLLAAMARALGDEAARARALVLAVERDGENLPLTDEAVLAIQSFQASATDATRPEAIELTERLAKRIGLDRLGVEPGAEPYISGTRRVATLSPAAMELSPPTGDDEGDDTMSEALDNLEAPPVSERTSVRPSFAAPAIETRPSQAPERSSVRPSVRPSVSPTAYSSVRPSVPPTPSELSDPLAAWKDRARAAEARAESAVAEDAWRNAREIAPDDLEVERGLEALLAARGAHADLADLLSKRAERLSRLGDARDEGALRATRLRRAALLEQRLGRVGEACDELARLLVESPDNESALGYLADLYERMGESIHAAALWRRAADITRDDATRHERRIRAARTSLASGDTQTAFLLLDLVLQARHGDPEALEMRVAVARAAAKDEQDAASEVRLADALYIWSEAAPVNPEERADLLIESAQAIARSGDGKAALERARRAARLTPDRPRAQLYARGLEYRLRGAGAPDEAKQTIEALRSVIGPFQLEGDDAALHAFLLAEALDAVQGGGAGLHALEDRRRITGDHPLVSVALAERSVAQWRFSAAVPLFEQALAGDLLGMRRPAAVALAAADAALRAERVQDAIRFLETAALDAEVRNVALRRLAHVVAAAGDVNRSREVLHELARGSTGEDRARTLAQLGRALLASLNAEDRAEGLDVFAQAIEGSPRGSVLEAQLQTELATLRQKLSIVPPGATPIHARISGAPAMSIDELEKQLHRAESAGERADAKVALSDAYAYEGRTDKVEPLLWEAFHDGSMLAATRLAARLDDDPSRVPERINVRRRLVDAHPGSPEQLRALHAAALADRNFVYARAIEHVLRAFDPGAGPVPPPPLGVQEQQPGMLALLTRHAHEVPGEAMGIVWEGAQAALAMQPQHYGVTGLERLYAGNATPMSRLYECSLRLLDAPAVPIYLQRGETPLTSQIALLQPASVILNGDAREDSSHVRFTLGFALGAALPQSAIVLGLPENEARTVWHAVLGGFGPTQANRKLDSLTGPFAETLWQTLPGRSQRRLRDLLARPSSLEFERLVARARQSARRVGFFLTGDFADVATRIVAADPVHDVRRLREPGGLEAVAAEVPELADLIRLAVRPEYADARWRPPPSGAARTTISSSRLRVR